MKVLIGGYTKHASKGIYELPLSTQPQPVLGQAQLVAEVGGPTYFQTAGDLLFTINNAGDQGGISLFKRHGDRYEKLADQLTPGASPAYLGINPKAHLLYTANYHTAVLSIYRYSENSLSLVTTYTAKAESLGPRPEQVDGPHPHFFDQTPQGNLVACDLGNDSVTFFRFDGEQLTKAAVYHNESGFGTRHIRFSPDGHYFYVVGELSSKINVVKFNEDDWTFESLGTYSTIPADFHEHNGAAALYLSRDGKYLYVSNRGHNSLAVFAVEADQNLRLVQRVSVFGDFPRDFNWNQDQSLVIVANQNSNNATLYRRDAASGMLTPLQKEVAVPEGTRVLFEA
ncbi:lactonase family protein [Lactobacillus corticis]|uniref:6-phosphogluconolactonase n=1 Tax=Lactobacillus corticis TaxID=2201249 RepID=A0A916QIR7_9LACO|nr:lactonase family protein [Lactobacillus corticis]GFZ26208.1 6-phosphogluconolactonase [Lactobacillus corticis]